MSGLPAEVVSEMRSVVESSGGFLAALDQSGGSSPTALRNYGVDPVPEGDDEMFDLIHEMRSRIITSPSFSSDQLAGAILFEGTVRREVGGRPTPEFLWQEKHIVPFMKVDKGLADEESGVQLMKPITDLDEQLTLANERGVYGTKMRSVIKEPVGSGVADNVAQQFEIGMQILDRGLMPIIEPEVSINSEGKDVAEGQLFDACMEHLGSTVPDGSEVMLKLTLPTTDGRYRALVDHPKVLKVVALSGGYPIGQACDLLGRNPGVVASFSRALLDGLLVTMSDDEFDRHLGGVIGTIHGAAVA
ncbi:MAG: class I fructose-bisphosphate aldolase [Actinomycetota bacterium]